MDSIVSTIDSDRLDLNRKSDNPTPCVSCGAPASTSVVWYTRHHTFFPDTHDICYGCGTHGGLAGICGALLDEIAVLRQRVAALEQTNQNH